MEGDVVALGVRPNQQLLLGHFAELPYQLETLPGNVPVYGQNEGCHKNCLLSSRVYAQKFSEINDPKPTVFKRLLNQFEESGSVNYKEPITRKSATEDEENVFTIIGSVIEIPNVSQNLISKSTNISQSKLSKSTTFILQLCLELYANDFENRTEFCMWVLDKVAENENDEYTFHNSLVNRHNFHYYSDTNQRVYKVMKNQNTWSVNVWGGILGQYLIGPYFFEGHLTGLMFPSF
ncbi:hypothetical protein D910_08429 [Dendroctonus ponderosae]|uniref:DUF4817 domain-containing protein n=1 Tax=Dendroctonus ponderosae TaxID=77166 RepID=U4UDF3_DENPD|nr:hypothetical protein D910_08429 [Dendroctonus ponderosae]